MRKIALIAIVVFVLMPVVAFAAKKNPVVMTIGGEKVKLSEFEYLYKKNNAQLATDMTLDEYIDMFVNYKLKVCAAMDAKLDTLASYRNDMEKYSAELAQPYMVDEQMLDSFVNEAYSRMVEVIDMHHLMLPLKTTTRNESAQFAFADSIRNLLANGADFEQMVKKHSVERSAMATLGKMTVTGGYLFSELEDAVYKTPAGGVTEVTPSRVGLHIFKVDARRPHPGEVKARHLLVNTRGVPVSEHAAAYAKADSLRRLVLAGADFATVASQNTDDPSGKKTGGDLPWFGPGRMIKEFETAAYSLKDGEVSKPVKTAFGYHILLREGSRPVAPIDSVKDDLLISIKMDSRYSMATRRAVEHYVQKSNSKINTKISGKVQKIIEKHGGLNDASRNEVLKLKDVAYTIDGQKYSVNGVIESMPKKEISECDSAIEAFDKALKAGFWKDAEKRMRATLADREPAYGNLINEYSDGMLLYEISSRRVWDKANTDLEGLEAFYQAHKDAYKWDVPHYKGYVICAESDSIAQRAEAFLETLEPGANYVTELRKKFSNKAKIERVITACGASPVVDYIAFGGALPKTDNRWKAYVAFGGVILNQPESALDVKGAVGVDYQQYLEEEWIKELNAKYPVEINRNLIKKSVEK